MQVFVQFLYKHLHLQPTVYPKKSINISLNKTFRFVLTLIYVIILIKAFIKYTYKKTELIILIKFHY